MRNQYRKILLCCVAAAGVLTLSGCSGEQKDDLQELQLTDERPETAAGKDKEQSQKEDGKNAAEPEDVSSGEGEDAKEAENPVFVYVCGAVNIPGVYELADGARVFEALKMAGGVTEEAVPEMVDQARLLVDGERIYVPTFEETQQNSIYAAETSEDGTQSRKVNINTAGQEELMTLTGIGEAKAQSIIAYREENGGFESVEEIMEIEGIKDGVFSKIKDDITI